jgi:hypothetical protein
MELDLSLLSVPALSLAFTSLGRIDAGAKYGLACAPGRDRRPQARLCRRGGRGAGVGPGPSFGRSGACGADRGFAHRRRGLARRGDDLPVVAGFAGLVCRGKRRRRADGPDPVAVFPARIDHQSAQSQGGGLLHHDPARISARRTQPGANPEFSAIYVGVATAVHGLSVAGTGAASRFLSNAHRVAIARRRGNLAVFSNLKEC